MLKKSTYLVCFLLASVITHNAGAQALFYDNSVETGLSDPAGEEIAVPIAFSGSYDVSSFVFRYSLPQNNPDGPTTDAIIRFYEPGLEGDAYTGSKLIAAFDEHDLAAGSNTVFQDLTVYGDNFRWNAMALNTGETGGWVSLDFSNPNAAWVTATGASQDDFFQQMSDGAYYDFNGAPQAAFYLQLGGRQIPAAVPEPGAAALLAGIATPGCLFLLLRRSRRRSRPGRKPQTL